MKKLSTKCRNSKKIENKKFFFEESRKGKQNRNKKNSKKKLKNEKQKRKKQEKNKDKEGRKESGDWHGTVGRVVEKTVIVSSKRLGSPTALNLSLLRVVL